MKRTIAFLLTLSLLLACVFGTFTTASATDGNGISLFASSYFTSYSATASANSNKTVSVTFNVTATGIMTTLGVSSIKIQKYSSGSWTTVETLTTSNTTGLQKSNAMNYANTVKSGTQSTGTYRAYVTFYAKNSSGSESKTYTTTSVYVS